MPQSLDKIILHAVFSTKNREPFLSNDDLRHQLHRYLGGVLKQKGCTPLIVGGTQDHVHLLFILPRTISVAEAIMEAKRASSLWIKGACAEIKDFEWQGGYGVFSVGFSQLEEVRAYIESQETHHKHLSFQNEYEKLLEKYQVSYDKKYLWE